MGRDRRDKPCMIAANVLRGDFKVENNGKIQNRSPNYRAVIFLCTALLLMKPLSKMGFTYRLLSMSPPHQLIVFSADDKDIVPCQIESKSHSFSFVPLSA